MTQPLQSPIADNQLRAHFKQLPFGLNATVQCTVQNSNKVLFRDASENHAFVGYASRSRGILVDKSLFYMKMMRKFAPKATADQRFVFDLVPDLKDQGHFSGFKWIEDIMREFPAHSVNLGILAWNEYEQLSAIAEFAFHDRANAMAFKLKYL